MSGKRRTFRLTFAATALLLLAGSFLLTRFTGDLSGARADLTSERLYTMSPSAKTILGDLKVPVQVKLYVTGEDQMPTELKTLERDVTDKLRDYASASDGMIQFSVHDPQDDEEMQDALTQRGIRPFQVQSIDKDEIGVKLIWSAMTIAYKDKPEEVIPQVLPQSLANLEYELVSRVYRLTRDRQPVVALVAPKQEVDQQTAMMYLQQGMQPPEPVDVYTGVAQILQQEHYTVRRVKLTANFRIPEDADALVVLNPHGLDARQAFEINRALSNGLNTLLAVQLHAYDYQPGPRGDFIVSGASQTTGLEDMLAGLGVTVDTRHLCDESNQMLSVPRTQNVGGLRFQTNEPVRKPIQIWVNESTINQDAPMTGRIANLLYLWGTALETDGDVLASHGLEQEVLFTASDRAWRVPFQDGMVPGSAFNASGKSMEPGLPLAVRLSGEFPDTFNATGAPAWAAAPGAEAPDPADDRIAPLAPAAAQLVVVGCAKMFDDMALQAGQNPLLLINAVDNMVHGDDLVSIRSKILTQRVIRPVSDREKLAFRIFVTALVPCLIAAYGLFRAAARRKEVTR
ncbi:MAG TPA: GldG family protein [Candidatus Krumholzibacteria bacterium]|nr:GldG family protein [Candidatus Krumholzibacteria bacterium]